MYCIQCGVKLGEGEKKCPLCGTVVYHPDLPRPRGGNLFPPFEKQLDEIRPGGVLFVMTMLFVLPVFITLLCNWHIDGRITWSAYVTGSLALLYVTAVLPRWFRRPNPVIFVPVSFGAAALYVMLIDLMTGGGWFLPFALPVIAGAALIVTAVVTLAHYVRRGYLYIFGGAFIAMGCLAVLTEALLHGTFGVGRPVFWSIYPLVSCGIIGLTLIVIAICRPLRESLRKKMFF